MKNVVAPTEVTTTSTTEFLPILTTIPSILTPAWALTTSTPITSLVITSLVPKISPARETSTKANTVFAAPTEVVQAPPTATTIQFFRSDRHLLWLLLPLVVAVVMVAVQCVKEKKTVSGNNVLQAGETLSISINSLYGTVPDTDHVSINSLYGIVPDTDHVSMNSLYGTVPVTDHVSINSLYGTSSATHYVSTNSFNKTLLDTGKVYSNEGDVKESDILKNKTCATDVSHNGQILCQVSFKA
ncbi:hypothetical protein FHG87_008950 [Trinorchestia longiramus]|nr:hypothetical protein FHG87_008950 [Trinorchestia longiramus]